MTQQFDKMTNALSATERAALLDQIGRMVARAMISFEVAKADTFGREIDWKYVNSAVSDFGPSTAAAHMTGDEGEPIDVFNWVCDSLAGIGGRPFRREQAEPLFEAAAGPFDPEAYVAELRAALAQK